jgi:hypothetical protein
MGMLWSKLRAKMWSVRMIIRLCNETPPHTLLVLPDDDERAQGFALTLYPAGLAEAGILRPKRRFPSGGYLRPKGHFPTLRMGAARTRKKGDNPTKNPE